MKVTYNWLKEIVDITATADDVAKRLTAAGLEVASLKQRHIPDGVIVADVSAVVKHPNSDHLTVCTVDSGASAPLTVVCGAPNVKAGMKVALATIGTTLGPEFVIKQATLRGVASFGMLCSEQELGISEDHSGIMSLPVEFVCGTPLKKYIPDDTVIEIELTPNRGDCLSVLGVAREVAAAYSKPLKQIARRPQQSAESVNDSISVMVEDSRGCPRYCGRMVRGVTIKESPLWLKRRLAMLDIRPISNVVDVTNYILLLFGQPMHAFDYATIAGKTIIVKRALDNQRFTTLDNIERKLTAEDLLICDGSGPTALAGVMGGAGSGISEKTTDVFLECAYFDPVGVRKTSKRLDLSTDSSYRFERGVDPSQGLVDAVDTAAALICELAGGSVPEGIIDICRQPIPKTNITLRPEQLRRVLGISLSKEKIIEHLTSLQIEYLGGTGEHLTFAAPQYRHDLKIEVDLIEEVGRRYGYDNIPTNTHAFIAMDQNKNNVEDIMCTIRTSLAGMGLHETVTNSMLSEKKCRLLTPDLEPVKVLNPLNPDMSCMRTTLLASLLDVTAYNINRKNRNNHLFEIGKNYINQGFNKQPFEPQILAVLLEGEHIAQSWNSQAAPLTFYILKSALETLCVRLGIAPLTYTRLEKGVHAFYTAESAAVGNNCLSGTCGRLRREITEEFGIKTAVYYAELDITTLLNRGVPLPHYTALPRFPAVERDFCFVMDERLESAAIVGEISSLSNLVESVQPFDVYRGEKLPAGKKSIAFSILLRTEDRTLTDKEAENISKKIINAMQGKFGATLRE